MVLYLNKDYHLNNLDVADPETTTPNGCTCTSLCGGFKKDWCYVEGNCGTSSLIPFKDNYDYCLYQANAQKDFYDLDWKAKQNLTWNKVTANSTSGKNHPSHLLKRSMKTSFDNEWDELPKGRKKVCIMNILIFLLKFV